MAKRRSGRKRRSGGSDATRRKRRKWSADRRADRAIANLYAGPLDSFTKRRTQLASSLRETGHQDAAKRVGDLRKPTVAVWAINRAANEAPARVSDYRGATDASSGRQATPAVLRRVSATLEGAAADTEGRTALEDGRLTEERRAPGLEALAAMRPAKAARPDRDRGAVRRRRQALKKADAEAHRLHHAADRAEDRVERARKRLRDAESDARRARDRADAAQRKADEARSALAA